MHLAGPFLPPLLTYAAGCTGFCDWQPLKPTVARPFSGDHGLDRREEAAALGIE